MTTSSGYSELPNVAYFALESAPEEVKKISLNRASPSTLKKVFKLGFLPQVVVDPYGTSVVHQGEQDYVDGWSPKLIAETRYLVNNLTAVQVFPQGSSVVIQQPGAFKQFNNRGNGEPMRAWNSGVCRCMGDPAICLGVYCLTPCLMCIIAKAMGEGQCFACLFPQMSLYFMRRKLRMEENIQGTEMDDYFMSHVCFLCTMCQVSRELKALGRWR